jgi:hypothetical protein
MCMLFICRLHKKTRQQINFKDNEVKIKLILLKTHFSAKARVLGFPFLRVQ